MVKIIIGVLMVTIINAVLLATSINMTKLYGQYRIMLV